MSHTPFLTILLLFSCILWTTLWAQICDDYEECMDQKRVEAKLYELECRGEASCLKTELVLSETKDSIWNPSCEGARSCRQAQITSDKAPYCLGFQSCKGADIDFSGYGTSCGGQQSCMYAAIHKQGAFSDYDGVNCPGKGSCQQARATGNNYVEVGGRFSGQQAKFYPVHFRASGELSALNAIIDSRGQEEMTVQMYGYHAGKGALVRCRRGSQCELYCFATACKDLTYQCDKGATCTQSKPGCRETDEVDQINSVDGSDCPIFTTNDRSQMFEDHLNDDDKEDDEDDLNKDVIWRADDSENVKICDKDDRCYYQDLVVDSLRCRAKGSCARADVQVTSAAESPGFIQCGGYHSCEKASIVNEVEPDTYIECGAEFACHWAKFKTVGNMFCTATDGCERATIQAQGFVACTGFHSCTKATIEAERVYLDGGYQEATKIKADYVRVGGTRGLWSGIVDSEGRERVVVDVRAFAYDSDFVCRDGSRCKLICQTTCFTMTFTCAEGAECTIDPPECEQGADSVGSIKCPEFNQGVTNQEIEDIVAEMEEKRAKAMEEEDDQHRNRMSDEDMEDEQDLIEFVESKAMSINGHSQWLQMKSVVVLMVSVVMTVVAITIYSIHQKYKKSGYDDIQ